MKIVRFAIDEKVGYGILEGESIQALEDEPYRDFEPTDCYYQLNEVQLLSPCRPAKILTLGLNYHSHAEEIKAKVPNGPMVFPRPSTAVIGPEDGIIYPSAATSIDYEGELAVVVKKPMWLVSEEDALGYVLGYTCFNDVTVRNPHYQDKRWTRAKSFDTFAAVGPCIETELDPGNAVLETYLNGELRQKANTNDLIYSVPELINFISHALSLMPGDIIATGTPSGVGSMYPGDTVEVKIDGIGTLRNYVVGDR